MSKIEAAARYYAKGEILLHEIEAESHLPFDEVVEKIDHRKRVIEDLGI